VPTLRHLPLALFLALPAPLAAQSLIGYAPASAERQRRVEATATGVPTAASARHHARELSRETHVAGTPAQARTRDYVIAQMQAMGLQTEVRAYDVWLPHPTSVRVWRLDPQPRALALAEGPVAADPATQTDTEYPTVNGYSGAGDVRGEVVFVNYGLIEDYAILDSLGVSVRGKIAIARYGRSFRGIKAREAEKRGAVGLLLYSDPQDDGFARGDVYPEGPMRPPQGVQRGSVMNGAGDPSTPGWPSTRGARRVPLAEMPVPRIPVVPIGYGSASELLRDVRGTAIPPAWQGGLAFRYHVGPGPVQARIAVTLDTATAAYKTIWNTFGIVRGSEFPDEVVVIGAHRDAWSPGAADNVSGTVSVLEAARAVAEQVRRGERPKRTMLFATWDAEEWGLVGSSEYVEDDSLRLVRGGVAYLNQDVSASGSSFGGGGSPSLRATLRAVVRTIPDPDGRGSVYDAWRRRANVADSLEPAMGDPGGGSDFAGFYNHLGIPHSDWGFGGEGGVYHSRYDSHHWMTTFGDTSFAYHATAARIGTAMMLRLANADILPYDYVEFARTMRRYTGVIDRAMAARGWRATSTPLVAALERMEASARTFADARDAALARELPAATRARTNAALRRVERALTRPEGLRSRPWYRNLIYASDMDNGYSTMVFPSINEAVRYGDEGQAVREVDDLVTRLGAAVRALDEARAALGAR
jgi:N-acetylated-alpha-linked acidic dipeptidase